MGVHVAGTQHGHTYYLGPLKGTRAPALIALRSRAPAAQVGFWPLQHTIWQIEAGMSYSEMSSESRQLIDRLIPEYKSQLRDNFVKRLHRACGGMRAGILGPLCNEINALNASYQQVQRTLEQYGNNYEALAHQIVHVLPGVYPNPGPASWSRLSPRVYARVTGGHIWQETSTLEIRVLPQSGGQAANEGPQAFWHNASYSLMGGSGPAQNVYNDTAEVPIGAVIAYPDVGTGVQVLGPEPFGGGAGPTVQLVTPAVNRMSVTVNGVAKPSTPGATITHLSWNWGDGSPAEVGWFPQTHTYVQAGSYTITVTATDSNGQTGSAEEGAVISSPAAAKYTVTFTPLGLKDVGGLWSVTMGTSTLSKPAGEPISFIERNGVYTYSATAGHTACVVKGTVAVTGADVKKNLPFLGPTFSISVTYGGGTYKLLIFGDATSYDSLKEDPAYANHQMMPQAEYLYKSFPDPTAYPLYSVAVQDTSGRIVTGPQGIIPATLLWAYANSYEFGAATTSPSCGVLEQARGNLSYQALALETFEPLQALQQVWSAITTFAEAVQLVGDQPRQVATLIQLMQDAMQGPKVLRSDASLPSGAAAATLSSLSISGLVANSANYTPEDLVSSLSNMNSEQVNSFASSLYRSVYKSPPPQSVLNVFTSFLKGFAPELARKPIPAAGAGVFAALKAYAMDGLTPQTSAAIGVSQFASSLAMGALGAATVTAAHMALNYETKMANLKDVELNLERSSYKVCPYSFQTVLNGQANAEGAAGYIFAKASANGEAALLLAIDAQFNADKLAGMGASAEQQDLNALNFVEANQKNLLAYVKMAMDDSASLQTGSYCRQLQTSANISRPPTSVTLPAIHSAISGGASAASTSKLTRSVRVPGNIAWTPTGINLSARQQVTVTASGGVSFSAGSRPIGPGGTPPSCYVAANGPYGWRTHPYLANGLPCGSLVGRIGEKGKIFEIGSKATIHAATGGQLYLGVNDNAFWDNSGGWNVTVAASSLPAITSKPTVTLAVQPGTVEAGSRTVVSGTVKSVNGISASGMKVELTASEGGTRAPSVTVTTENDGSFRLPFSAPATSGNVIISARLASVANSPVVTAVLQVLPKASAPAPRQFPSPGLPSSPATIRAAIQDGGTSLQLPAGRLYIYGMVTGGAAPSSPFAIGRYAQVKDAAGQLAAALAYGINDSNSYTTATGYHVIGGASVIASLENFKAYYGANSRPRASSASVNFTVSRNSVVVVVALASSQQSVTLSGIPGLQMDATSSGPGASLGMLIGHAKLGPGNYTVKEQSAALAAGQDPDHMADLVGVFVFQ